MSLATRHLLEFGPADPSRLYLPKEHGGLGVPSISGLYKKLQVGRTALLITSRDKDLLLKKESPVPNCEVQAGHPSVGRICS